jgi:hypothetical protein
VDKPPFHGIRVLVYYEMFIYSVPLIIHRRLIKTL